LNEERFNMKFTLTEPKYLKESVNIISELVNEVTFKFDTDKMELVAMDPANVAMVMFRLLSSAFVEYKVDGPTEVSISLESLKQILKRSKPSDTITMNLDKERNRLNISLIGEGKRDFTLSLIDMEDNSHKVPSLDFKTTMEMAPVIFDEAVEDMGVIAESVALLMEDGRFIVKANNNLNSAKVEFPKENVNIVTDENKVTAKYSIEYLKKMVKGSKLSTNMKVMFNNDYPLRLEYNVLDKMQLVFILAPRVDSN